MNRFEIFPLLALVCISSAPAQAKHIFHCKLEKAMVHNGRSLKTFDIGGVSLYRITHVQEGSLVFYEVGDGLGAFSDYFVIDPNMTVTEEMVYIEFFNVKVKLILDGIGKTFGFYRDLYTSTLEDFHRNFYAAKIVLGKKVLCDDICVIRAKRLPKSELWLFVAEDLADDTHAPRLIFPRVHLDLKSSKRSNKKVFLILELLEKIEIHVQCHDSPGAKLFHDFVIKPEY